MSNLFLPKLIGSSPYNINISPTVWGDGLRSDSEVCDDGNTNNGDGWSSSWLIESGWTCAGGSSTSKDICIIQTSSVPWGNGITETALNEQWDDGNTNNGDGWSATWTIEQGYVWEILSNLHYLSLWSISCGNGRINSGEGWDDGNFVNGDGWNSNCMKEAGYDWANFGKLNIFW